MPRKHNRLVIHDTEYEITPAYIAGAQALRAEVPHWANPHRDNSQRHADWAYGHDNEAGGEHRMFDGTDVITAPATGTLFEMDPAQKRNTWGDVIAA